MSALQSIQNSLINARQHTTLKTAAEENRRQIINFSVRAQDYIIKKNIKTTDDISQMIGSSIRGGVVNANASLDSTVASQNVTKDGSIITQKKFVHSQLDPLATIQLPKINAGNVSPFKGLIDISLVSQKIRKGVEQNKIMKGVHSMRQSMGVDEINMKTRDNFFKGPSDYEEQEKFIAQHKRGKTQSGERASQRMNPKILETWINETLQDAEHLDIPGVILKSEQKTPLNRYGIGRIDFQSAGLDEPTIDRVYRALFVYSVGFYELIDKCLEHTNKKYTIIVSIWKVFSILLEYCCRTDYRMMISKIVQENDIEKEKLRLEYDKKFQEQANNEKLLKQTIEQLTKHCETVEKDRQNEKAMRLKLEEEYQQNSKNHEEEVQLRLKFESKLNNMHSAHRDLETRFKRTKQDLQQATDQKNYYQEQVNLKIDEITNLKTKCTEQASKIINLSDKVEGLTRDLQVKSDQFLEKDQQTEKIIRDLDELRYKFAEQHKEITELKLKTDVLQSTNNSLQSEKDHLTIELKETRSLQKSYEQRCGELITQLNQTQSDYQKIMKTMIGSEEMAKEREFRIQKLKEEVSELKLKYEELDIEHGTLKINHFKITEQNDISTKDLQDTIEKLHLTNKVRHETEVKLGEEIEKTKNLQEIIRMKEDTLGRRATEIEEQEKKIIELERIRETLDLKINTAERTGELNKKQLNEKIQSLNEILAHEKVNLETWVGRFEKEQQDHTATTADLLQKKSELKDQILETKNAEIKFQTCERQLEVITQQNKEFQHTINVTTAKMENFERELSTQKEILKQFEASKKEYVAKLKRELETIEEKYSQLIHQTQMTGEDYRSQAFMNLQRNVKILMVVDEQNQQIKNLSDQLKEKCQYIQELEKQQEDGLMVLEDHYCQIFYKSEIIEKMREIQAQQLKQIQILNEKNTDLKIDLDELQSRNQELVNDLQDSNKNQEKLKKELGQQIQDLEEDKIYQENQINQLNEKINDLQSKIQDQQAIKKESSKNLKTEKSEKVYKPETTEKQTQTDDVIFGNNQINDKKSIQSISKHSEESFKSKNKDGSQPHLPNLLKNSIHSQNQANIGISDLKQKKSNEFDTIPTNNNDDLKNTIISNDQALIDKTISIQEKKINKNGTEQKEINLENSKTIQLRESDHIESKKSSKMSQKQKISVHHNFISSMNQSVSIKKKIPSEQTFSQHSSNRANLQSQENKQQNEILSPQGDLLTIKKNSSNDEQSRGENSMQDDMNIRQQQIYQPQNRMKVNINNQNQNDQSYGNIGNTQNNMLPQMIGVNDTNIQNQLQQSIKQNNRRVTGTSAIRNLIKIAVTRD